MRDSLQEQFSASKKCPAHVLVKKGEKGMSKADDFPCGHRSNPSFPRKSKNVFREIVISLECRLRAARQCVNKTTQMRVGVNGAKRESWGKITTRFPLATFVLCLVQDCIFSVTSGRRVACDTLSVSPIANARSHHH